MVCAGLFACFAELQEMETITWYGKKGNHNCHRLTEKTIFT